MHRAHIGAMSIAEEQKGDIALSLRRQMDTNTVRTGEHQARFRSPLPLPQIARKLGLDGIVEGSVVRSGGRVCISSQLILASTDQHLWAHSYERDLSGIISLQGEVAQAIAAQVRAAITQQQRSRFEAAQPVNREAYDLYHRGLYHWNQYSPAGTVDAIMYFRQAVQKDPGLAAANAGLAVAYDWGTVSAGSAPTDAFSPAKAAALKALQDVILDKVRRWKEFTKTGDLPRETPRSPYRRMFHRYTPRKLGFAAMARHSACG